MAGERLDYKLFMAGETW